MKNLIIILILIAVALLILFQTEIGQSVLSDFEQTLQESGVVTDDAASGDNGVLGQ